MAAGFLSFIWNNKFGLPSLPPPGTFNGKTILITGASSGLGLEAAIHFVNLGASSVIITARNEARGNAAKEDILKRTRTKDKDTVKVMELDMDNFSSTKAFVDRVKTEVKMIDYVLLNAGLLNVEFKQSSEGFEETIQVNVLSTALLGILLLPWIKEAGNRKAHLGFVTSGLHSFVRIDGDFPRENVLAHFNQKENWPKAPPRNPMYAISKLLEHYVVNEIVRLSLGPDGKPEVIINPMCPGLVKSNLARPYKTSFLKSLLVDIFYILISKSTEGGARSLVIPALTTPAENGKFIKPYSTDELYNAQAEKNITGPEGRRMQAQVWKEVLAILEEKVPEVKEIVAQNTA